MLEVFPANERINKCQTSLLGREMHISLPPGQSKFATGSHFELRTSGTKWNLDS